MDHAGLRVTGRRHEVCLNDARRTAPERLRTTLRPPVMRLDTAAGGTSP